MNRTDFINAGIRIGESDEDELYAEAALDWLKKNTSIPVGSLENLPAGAKLFIMRYGSIMQSDSSIASESLGGMSQSFRSSSKADLIADLASQLLGDDVLSGSSITVVPVRRGWNCGC